MLGRIVVGVLVVATLVGALLASRLAPVDDRVSGFVEAHEIRLGSRVGGRVLRVLVGEGQAVHAADLLVELEPYDLADRRAEAAARLAAARAHHELLSSGFRPEEIAQTRARRDQLAARLSALEAGPREQEIQAASARLDAARAQLSLAQANFDRTRLMFERKASSREDLDRAEDERKTAQANTRVREEELGLLREGTRAEEIAQARAELDEAAQALSLREAGFRTEEIAQARAEVEAAAAALGAVERQLGELAVRAPADGVVEALGLRPGDLVPPNAPVVSMLDLGTLWVRAYVPENRLDLALGQRVVVTVDSFPGREFAGHVSFVARQAEFTPGNVQTPEERSKQVFRIKVEIDEGRDQLRPGMIADVWLGGAR